MKNFISAFFVIVMLCLCVSSSWARPTYGRHGLVVSASDLASAAGVTVLKEGGNAADAAVATAFALAVTRPYYASLGGGGFLLARFGGKIMALDYRERAPHKSKEDMFAQTSENASINGGLAVGTPGNVRGLYALHKKYGRLSWSKDLAPAVELAKSGFMVTEELARITHENFKDFNDDGRRILSIHGKEMQVGDKLKQPGLAQALELIQKKGADGFYKGPVAEDVIATDKKAGGILDNDDLQIYQARWVEPLHITVFGADIYSMPPPSSGGAILFSELKMSEALKLQEQKPYGHEELHLMAEIMNRAFFDRQFLGDPRYTDFPADEIYRDERIARWVETINPTKKTYFDPQKFELRESVEHHEKGNTTHYVVADGQGNVVSATTTINTDYGSDVVTAKYGITLNNEMDDFTTRPGQPNIFGLIQGKANDIAPLKTPLSSMTPTIVEKNGKFLVALGSMGGPRIINVVYQILYHALTTPLNIDELVQQPRIHQQYKPDKLYYDPTLSPDSVSALEKMGHQMTEPATALAYAIRVLPDGLMEGAFDSRGEGGASGY